MALAKAVWENGGMATEGTAYTWKAHWNALRRSRSVKWIVSAFVVSNASVAFFRGQGFYWQDLRTWVSWFSLEWVLGISVLALIALLVAVFHETKTIVQAKISDHEKAILHLTEEYEKTLETKQKDHSRILQETIEANERTKTDLFAERTNRERIEGDLKRRLVDPILHLEPEHGLLSAEVPNLGKFQLSLENTGVEDVERVDVFIDYFIAQKGSEGVSIKRVGGFSLLPSQTVSEISSKHKANIDLDFSELLPIMKEVALNSPTVMSRNGVRVFVKFRRKADGREFSINGAFGVSQDGHMLHTPDHMPRSMPDNLRHYNILSFSEIIPFMSISCPWSQVITEIASKGDGTVTRKYR